MSEFKERLELTEKVESFIKDLFPSDKCSVIEFGCKSIIGENEDLWEFIKEPIVNQQASSMIVKFAPDFILLRKTEPKELYFIDVKHSIAPTWAPSRLKMLREKNSDNTLSIDRIGVVAREALLAYRRYYPNTIVLMACPYNAKLLMAQFAADIKCLYCYHAPNRDDYDCASCPAQNGGFFDIERAVNSAGSQTPMTNIDLDSFLPADEFFNNIGIQLNENALNNLFQEIKKETIDIGRGVYPNLKNRALWNINHAGCDWVDFKVYSSAGNDVYHIDKNCECMSENRENIEAYATLAEALLSGKKTSCSKCCPNSD